MALPCPWNLYFHALDNDDWARASYEHVLRLETVDDLVHLHRAFANAWCRGMFFIMRDTIFPLWEAEENKAGGAYSFRIDPPHVPHVWYDVCARALGHTLTAAATDVNGVSLTPKHSFCLCRIWTRTGTPIALDWCSPSPLIFKRHCAKITT